MSGAAERPIYLFAGFRLDAQHRVLSRADGEPIPLTPKVFDTLLYLVEHPGQLLDKRNLLDAIWPKVIVEENNLNQCISSLRRVLGEKRGDHTFIVTEQGRGYRFVAKVEVEQVRTSEIPEVAKAQRREERAGAERRSHVRMAVYAVGVLAALVVAVAAYFSLWPSATERDLRSIAVLPFVDGSAADENAGFLADGVHADLLTQLSKIAALRVISSTSVMEYRDRPRNLRDIARELDVATVLEGTVQRAGDVVRINVQLIDAQRDEHLWAEAYERTFSAENVFAIQSDMATSIAGALRATLTPGEVTQLTEVPTASARAYELYLAGNEIMFRLKEGGGYISDGRNYVDVQLALQMYERALAEDPQLALAAANSSLAHTLIFARAIDATPRRAEMALEAAQRALALEPDLPEAHRALGFYFNNTPPHRLHDALRELTIAARGSPSDPRVVMQQADVYMELGRWQEAAAMYDRLLAIDPRNPSARWARAGFFFVTRNYEQAELALDSVLELAPDHLTAHELRADIARLRAGDTMPLKALANNPPVGASVADRQRLRFRVAYFDNDFATQLRLIEDDLLELPPVPWQPAQTKGLLYRLNGERELAAQQYATARSVLEPLVAGSAPEHAGLHLALAEALAGVGEPATAVHHAKRAMELVPPSSGVVRSQSVRLNAIYVFAAAGAADEAFTELEKYLSGPGAESIESLAVFPRLNTLHDDPRFRDLQQRFSRGGGFQAAP